VGIGVKEADGMRMMRISNFIQNLKGQLNVGVQTNGRDISQSMSLETLSLFALPDRLPGHK
jgi:hypothetical protein